MKKDRRINRKGMSVCALCVMLSAGSVYLGGCGRSADDSAALQKEMSAAENVDFSEENTEQGTETGDTGEKYRSPELQEYNQTAVDHMLQVENKGVNIQNQSEGDYMEALEDTSGVGEVESWQMIMRDPETEWQSCENLLDFYFQSYQPEKLYVYEGNADSQDYFSRTEEIEYAKIAGNDRDFVVVMNFKRSLSGEEPQQFLDRLETWGNVYTDDSGSDYLYGNAALHIRMPRDYVCELVDIADADTVLAAFAQADPSHASDYENALIPVIPRTAETGRFRVSDGTLQVTFDGGEEWTDVPLSTDLLFERGDERDGALTQVQDGSYTVSEDLAAIAYGGSPSMPVSVILSTDGGQSWEKVTVPAETSSARQLFLCRAGQSDTLYLVATRERSMSFEGESLCVSTDKGRTWSQVDSRYKGEPYHFTDIDASFTDENTGFLCMRDSQAPSMLYTVDGGNHWLEAQFDTLPQGYTMAYAPRTCEEGLELYVGRDGYTKYSGSMYRMISTDGGVSWKAAGEYYFK